MKGDVLLIIFFAVVFGLSLSFVKDSKNAALAKGADTLFDVTNATAYAIILGIDALLDMGCTSLNVTGDMVGSSIVSKSEKELDLAKWEKA